MFNFIVNIFCSARARDAGMRAALKNVKICVIPQLGVKEKELLVTLDDERYAHKGKTYLFVDQEICKDAGLPYKKPHEYTPIQQADLKIAMLNHVGKVKSMHDKNLVIVTSFQDLLEVLRAWKFTKVHQMLPSPLFCTANDLPPCRPMGHTKGKEVFSSLEKLRAAMAQL